MVTVYLHVMGPHGVACEVKWWKFVAFCE